MRKKLKISKRKNSNFYVGILLVVTLSFLFFSGSKAFLWDDSAIIQTAYGKENRMNTTNVKLDKWQYNPNNGLMQVDITMERTGKATTESEIGFFAKERSKPLEKIPVKIAAHFDNHYTILIEKIPNDFSVIGLVVTETTKDKEIKIDTDDLFSEESVEKNLSSDDENEEAKTVTLYGDYRKVETNKNLKELSEHEYVLQSIDNEIKSMNSKKEELKQLIPQQEETIEELKTDINTLNEDKVYQTPDEISDTESEIKEKEEGITEVENNKKEVEDAINTLDEKIKKLKEKKEKQAGKSSRN